MVATLQLEVAQRLMAAAGRRGLRRADAAGALDYEPREWFKIPAACFFPAPDVDSACVSDRRGAAAADRGTRPRSKIVKRGFSQRRKMMLKLLKQDWPAGNAVAAFGELLISPLERAEKLSLEQFVALTKRLQP